MPPSWRAGSRRRRQPPCSTCSSSSPSCGRARPAFRARWGSRARSGSSRRRRRKTPRAAFGTPPSICWGSSTRNPAPLPRRWDARLALVGADRRADRREHGEALAHRRPRHLARPAAMGGRSVPGQTRLAARLARRRARQARRSRRPLGRDAARAGLLYRSRRVCLCRARACRRAAHRPRRGRHRRRQDARLSRARVAVGGEERAGAVDLDLHPQPAASDRSGDRPPLSRPRGAQREGRGAQGPGELSLPAELRGGRQAHRARARAARRRARPDRALGRGHARRRHLRHRLPRLPRRVAVPARDHRPARRMRLCRLPALSHLLHRARHPPRPSRAHRRRQPRARHRAGGAGLAQHRRDQRFAARAARALRLRRGPSSFRRRRQRLRGAGLG